MIDLIIIECRDVSDEILAPEGRWYWVRAISKLGKEYKLMMKYDLSDLDIELLKTFLSGRCD
jgi:hypothetical protein